MEDTNGGVEAVEQNNRGNGDSGEVKTNTRVEEVEVVDHTNRKVEGRAD